MSVGDFATQASAWATRKRLSFGGVTTPQTFLNWREEQQAFEHLAAVWNASLWTREAAGHPEQVWAIRVTAEFFAVLRAAPLAGRAFACTFRRPSAAKTACGPTTATPTPW